MRSKRGAATLMAAVSAVLVTTGCADESARHPEARHVTYTYTCCRRADVARVLHPGEVVRVHWIVSEGAPSTSAEPTPVTLAASLSGPYRTVDGLKSASSAAAAATAAPIRTTDRAGGAPISTIVIPRGAAGGFYDLMTEVASPGVRRSGASVIRVMDDAG